MDTPLLETKFYVPNWRRGLVPRPRLSDCLNRGVESRLTLVSAPAGFGKTTLLADWLAAVAVDGRTVTWLSLDQSDNHESVRRLLRTADPGSRVNGLLALVGSGIKSCGAVEGRRPAQSRCVPRNRA